MHGCSDDAGSVRVSLYALVQLSVFLTRRVSVWLGTVGLSFNGVFLLQWWISD